MISQLEFVRFSCYNPHMSKLYLKRDNAEQRRTIVAQLLKRGVGIYDIQQTLANPSSGKFYTVNPETGEPYSLATIQRDVTELRERWRAEIARDIGDHFAEQIAKLEELEKSAWGQNDLRLVLDILKEKSRLYGLYSPVRIQVDWRTEVVQMLVLGQVDVGMLEAEIDEPEILEGIITEARLLGYEEGSGGSEDEPDNREDASTEIIEIDTL